MTHIKTIIGIARDSLMDAQNVVKHMTYCDDKELCSWYKKLAEGYLNNFKDAHTKLQELTKHSESETTEKMLWDIMHSENMEWYNSIRFSLSNYN